MQRIEKNNKTSFEKVENNNNKKMRVIEHATTVPTCGTFANQTKITAASDCTCPTSGAKVQHISSTTSTAWCDTT
jgi:hypothetical protein